MLSDRAMAPARGHAAALSLRERLTSIWLRRSIERTGLASNPAADTAVWARRNAQVGIVALGIAAILRWHYAVHTHQARHHVISDALSYMELAHKFLEEPGRQSLSDTIWPPGAAAIWALCFSLDGTLELAAMVNWLASVSVVFLVGASARRVAGNRAAACASLLAALHFGFMHYAGYVLAEQLFGLAVAWAMYVSLCALQTFEPPDPQPRAARLSYLLSPVAAMSWALAALLRPQALPVFFVASLALLLYFARTAARGARWLALAVGVGILIIGVPAADRCTRAAEGHFCAVSNNTAMNMALGQAGRFFGLEFRDPSDPAHTTAWAPPALLHHGYTGLGRLPATIYDTPGILHWIAARFEESPSMFVARAVGNAFDLFGLAHWPDSYDGIDERVVTVWTQAVCLFILVPGVVGLWRALRKSAKCRDADATSVFLSSVLCGLFLTSALSLGEARYRIPFDSFFIVLASSVYVSRPRADITLERSSSVLMTKWGVALAGFWVVSSAALLIAISHPKLQLGRHLPRWSAPLFASERVETASLNAFSAPPVAGAAWDGPGHHVFRCNPRCEELRFTFTRLQHPDSITISLDHNDRYRLLFLHGDRVLDHVDVPVAHGPAGMRTEKFALPPTVQRGFDAVSVLPLYGDGRYSLGHLSLHERI